MLDPTALSPTDAAPLLARLRAEHDGAMRHLARLDEELARFAFEHFYPAAATIRNALEMLGVRDRERDDVVRRVRHLGLALVEGEGRAARWTPEHDARVVQRQAFATAKARVERLTHAITNSGRPSIPVAELTAYVEAVRDLHRVGTALLAMTDAGNERDSVRNELAFSACDRLQVRSAPKALLDRVRAAPAPVAVET